MDNKFLLGFTNEGNLVFAEVNYGRYFSVCFNEVEPFEPTDELNQAQVESFLECSGKDWKYDQCETHNCTPNELCEIIADEWDIEELYDISLYSETFDINGKEVYFMSCGCGQHDTRDYMQSYAIDEQLAKELFRLWDEYHLSNDITDEDMVIVKQFLNLSVDEDTIIEDFLKENF